MHLNNSNLELLNNLLINVLEEEGELQMTSVRLYFVTNAIY